MILAFATALLLSASGSLNTTNGVEVIRGDYIEVNTHIEWQYKQHDSQKWHRKELLTQIIVWKCRKDADNKYRPAVIAFQVIHVPVEKLFIERIGGEVSVTIDKRRFVGKYIFDSETTTDPERDNRVYYPMEDRERLRK